jgi:two-component system sensor histidine kinase UhpB
VSERRSGERRREDRDQARLFDRLITAEQDERRRLADYLHDTTVQSLSAIALMLDAALRELEADNPEDARTLLETALERQRGTIRSLRDLSFNLEPVVLRDQGFGHAVRELTTRLGLDEQIRFELAVEPADELAEKAQAALYQIIREALDSAVRRGPPTRISVRIEAGDGGAVEAVIADDAPGERRRGAFEAIAERAKSMNGRLAVDGRAGGTTVRVTLPAETVRK